MNAKPIIAVIAAVLLVSLAGTPVAAAQPAPQVDECENAERGPSDGGPPGFVAEIVPDFLADLLGSLPVPNFVKAAVGASTC